MRVIRNRRLGGFTWLELLFLIVVIVLLAGLLLPSIPASRTKADRINCVNNLKQVGLAARIWAGDFNDRFPSQVPVSQGGIYPTNSGQMSPRDVFRFFQVMSYELETPKILFCPTDKARLPTDLAQLNSGAFRTPFQLSNNLFISYFIGPNATPDSPDSLLGGDRNVYGPMTSPKSNQGYGNSPKDGSGTRIALGTNLSTNDPLRVGWTEQMHKSNGNVLTADGSVRQLSSRRLVQTLNESGDTNLPANVLLFP